MSLLIFLQTRLTCTTENFLHWQQGVDPQSVIQHTQPSHFGNYVQTKMELYHDKAIAKANQLQSQYGRLRAQLNCTVDGKTTGIILAMIDLHHLVVEEEEVETESPVLLRVERESRVLQAGIGKRVSQKVTREESQMEFMEGIEMRR